MSTESDEVVEILAVTLYAHTGREARDFPFAERDAYTKDFYRERARATIQRMRSAGFGGSDHDQRGGNDATQG